MIEEDKEATPEPSATVSKVEGGAKKKRATKAAPVRVISRYVVAAGRSLTTQGRIIDAGEDITADDVADIEALIKRGYVVKA